MVFFSCDGCGEMLKKNQVDNHARKCWNCESVSCVDCSVSFWGDDYKMHTTCLTEAERYEKTVFKGPRKHDKCNRKLTPQEAWMEVIIESAEKAPPNLVSYLQQISSLDNVPRKEKAFRNFAPNSLKLRGPSGDKIVSDIWNHISSFRQKKMEMKQQAEKDTSGESQVQPDNCQVKDSLVPSSSETSDKSERDQGPSTSISIEKASPKKTSKGKTLKKKNMKKIVTKALKKASKHQLKLKDLKKIVKDRIKEKKLQIEEDCSVSMMLMETVKSNGKELKLEKGKIITLLIA